MAFQFILLTLWSLSSSFVASSSGAPSLAKPNCQSHCGDVEIPFPFGIGPNCSINGSGWYSLFQIVCDDSLHPPKPFLNLTDGPTEVLEISVAGTLKVSNPITFSNCLNKTTNRRPPDLKPTPFWYSSNNNRFTSMSCGKFAIMTSVISGSTVTSGCSSTCNTSSSILTNDSCSGTNCCQTPIPPILHAYNTSFGPVLNADESVNTCNYAFLVDQGWFRSNTTDISAIGKMDYVPVVLGWVLYRGIDNSSDFVANKNINCTRIQCSCSKGYHGNPYLLYGCEDINECEDPDLRNICGEGICFNTPGTFICYKPDPWPSKSINLGIIVPGTSVGLLFLITGAWWLPKFIKKRRSIIRKRKYFRKNGGLLLEKQLASGEVNVEKIKLFNAKELERATDRFSIDRILGQGGQGTVYKGMLTDGSIVAVKKSKMVNGGDEIGQFINEIVILSQINHRNVVKLLGCCLEIEVPLLVYEFLPNGTLSQYIHGHDDHDFALPWVIRLQIGVEVAGALSYLHSSASMPIYHRDIKSSNILLDDNHRAKVADFGTSRSVAIDQTHLTMTHVNGTFGYLDPEYFRSSQFTDKSDVYSFGVVLAELLTGQKPISVMKSLEWSEWRSLANYFIVSMEENRLLDILDGEVAREGQKEGIIAVANLAKRCLNLKGKKRPTMKEVAVELEGILLSVKSSDVEQNFEEVGHARIDIANWDAASSSTGSRKDSGTCSSFDVQPPLYHFN